MNDNYLSRSNTDCLKGICAIMVVLCHVCSRTGIGTSIGLGPIYSAFGYWGVSGFIFLSGYGLVCSLQKNPDRGGYLGTFLRNRVLPVYLLMALLVMVYYVLKLMLSPEPPTAGEFVQSFFFGRTVISFGWYLQSIVLIYLIFYAAANLVLKHFKEHIGISLCLAIGVGMSLYVALCLAMGLDSTWYETAFSFVAGVAVACYKPQVDALLSIKRKTFALLVGFVVCFAASFVLGSGPFMQGAIKIACKMVSSVLFCLCSMSFMRIAFLENGVTRFLGRLYLEIYIIQGAIYLLLRNKYWSVESQWIFFVAAFTLVIVGAWLTKPLTTAFMNNLKLKTK